MVSLQARRPPFVSGPLLHVRSPCLVMCRACTAPHNSAPPTQHRVCTASVMQTLPFSHCRVSFCNPRQLGTPPNTPHLTVSLTAPHLVQPSHALVCHAMCHSSHCPHHLHHPPPVVVCHFFPGGAPCHNLVFLCHKQRGGGGALATRPPHRPHSSLLAEPSWPDAHTHYLHARPVVLAPPAPVGVEGGVHCVPPSNSAHSCVFAL